MRGFDEFYIRKKRTPTIRGLLRSLEFLLY